jgi:RNA polymerase sigma-70 factor (ECF subfamily)
MSSQAEASDDHLIRRLLRGYDDAFTAIYRKCSGPLYRFALHMTGDASMAEEIMQDTFVFLLANARAFEPSRGSLLSWLLGVARNHSRRLLGALHETEPLDESPERDLATDSDPLGEFTRRELIDAVRRVVGSLPPALREVVILCELQELDYSEAAAVLACPVGTVRSRLHRARALLVSKLQARCMA